LFQVGLCRCGGRVGGWKFVCCQEIRLIWVVGNSKLGCKKGATSETKQENELDRK